MEPSVEKGLAEPQRRFTRRSTKVRILKGIPEKEIHLRTNAMEQHNQPLCVFDAVILTFEKRIFEGDPPTPWEGQLPTGVQELT